MSLEEKKITRLLVLPAVALARRVWRPLARAVTVAAVAAARGKTSLRTARRLAVEGWRNTACATCVRQRTEGQVK